MSAPSLRGMPATLAAHAQRAALFLALLAVLAAGYAALPEDSLWPAVLDFAALCVLGSAASVFHRALTGRPLGPLVSETLLAGKSFILPLLALRIVLRVFSHLAGMLVVLGPLPYFITVLTWPALLFQTLYTLYFVSCLPAMDFTDAIRRSFSRMWGDKLLLLTVSGLFLASLLPLLALNSLLLRAELDPRLVLGATNFWLNATGLCLVVLILCAFAAPKAEEGA